LNATGCNGCCLLVVVVVVVVVVYKVDERDEKMEDVVNLLLGWKRGSFSTHAKCDSWEWTWTGMQECCVCSWLHWYFMKALSSLPVYSSPSIASDQSIRVIVWRISMRDNRYLYITRPDNPYDPLEPLPSHLKHHTITLAHL
jgi:hypothetical protein